jgi:hypothetical protein
MIVYSVERDQVHTTHHRSKHFIAVKNQNELKQATVHRLKFCINHYVVSRIYYLLPNN